LIKIAWDDTKTDGGSLTATEWNNHVTDQKNRSLISTGSGTPSSTPGSEGDIYIDIDNDQFYIALDTNSSADWQQVVFENDLSITASQVSDFDAEVSNNTDVSANTTHRTSTGADHSYINQDVTTSGTPSFGDVTITNDNGTNDSAYVPMVLHGTDNTPPTASGFPIGTIYIQYTA
jgi:hypothetical protein